MKALKEGMDIVVDSADKGNATLKMDREDYIKKRRRLWRASTLRGLTDIQRRKLRTLTRVCGTFSTQKE